MILGAAELAYNDETHTLRWSLHDYDGECKRTVHEGVSAQGDDRPARYEERIHYNPRIRLGQNPRFSRFDFEDPHWGFEACWGSLNASRHCRETLHKEQR